VKQESRKKLPLGWVETTLERIASVRKEQVSPLGLDGKIYLSLEHIESGSNRIIDRGRSEDVRSTKSVFRPGDVLYGKLRPYLNKVCQPDFGGICSTDILVFAPSSALHNAFLLKLLTRQETVEYANSHSKGINLPRISPKQLGELSIPFPPLNEQKRIVARIEELQARSRRAREALETIPDLIEQLRQSILAAAFRGDLTKEWRKKNPDVEPASELLKRIRTERRKRWEEAEREKLKAKGLTGANLEAQFVKRRKQYKDPAPINTTGLPHLSEGWCWCWLSEMGYMNRGKSRHRPRNAPHLHGGKHPFVQTGDIAQSNGRITTHCQTYSDAGLAQSKLWPEGTVCITIAANIGSSAVLTYPACFPDSVVGIIPDDRLCPPEYVEFFIRTVKNELAQFAPATAQKNINIGVLNSVAVPLAPRNEVDEIARLLRASLANVETTDTVINSNKLALNQLDQSILAKAFRGELVPQDPNDEPASVLLERIRAEKARKATRPSTSRKQKGRVIAKE
jgi:type I restriction enzyme S subunit